MIEENCENFAESVKFPLVACEILCSENLRLRDIFLRYSDNLMLLFSFLRKPMGELDMSATANFARVVLTLLRIYPVRNVRIYCEICLNIYIGYHQTIRSREFVEFRLSNSAPLLHVISRYPS